MSIALEFGPSIHPKYGAQRGNNVDYAAPRDLLQPKLRCISTRHTEHFEPGLLLDIQYSNK
jgi:hypothetical protein